MNESGAHSRERAALEAYRAAVYGALKAMGRGESIVPIRNILMEGLLRGDGYLTLLEDAIAFSERITTGLYREILSHYPVAGGCACGRDDERAARHIQVMNLPNIYSGECDCEPFDQFDLLMFEGRCTGCGALLAGEALQFRREVES